MTLCARIERFSRRLWRSRRAGVGTLAALALPVLVGAAGLAFDLNRGYEQRVVNQRTADLAALGAALAFRTSGEAAVLGSTARDIATANGLAAATTDAVLLDDFPTEGEQAVRVRVTRPVPYMLARALGLSGNFNVTASAIATLTASERFAPPCYLALSPGPNAILVTGGASIDAATCSVAAIGGVQNNGALVRGHDIISGEGDVGVEYGALVAEGLRFGGSFNAPAWNTNVPPADRRVNRATALSDPWAGDATLATARAQLGAVSALAPLSDPVTPGGGDWIFNWSPGSAVAGFRVGTSNRYVVPPGVYDIGRLEVAGGIEVEFASGSAITVSRGVANGGSSLVFGDGDLYVNGGFDSGSSGVRIGDGALWIGGGAVRLGGQNRKGDGDVVINATVSLGGGQSLTMGRGDHHFGGIAMQGGARALIGDGDFSSARGVVVSGGGSEFAIGDGDISIGGDPSGNAIVLGGGSVFSMGDGVFSANGHVDTQGGSRLIFGKTANHVINGDMIVRGGVQFGAGRYSINGDFVNGTGGAGAAWHSTLTGKTHGLTLEGEDVSGYDMAGIDVSFILSGTMNLAGGARTKLHAPVHSVADGQIAEMLIHSEATAVTTWSAGSTNSFAGTIYLPGSALVMDGGNRTVGSGRCMTLVARSIEVRAGAATGTACPRMDDVASGGPTRAGAIRLVR